MTDSVLALVNAMEDGNAKLVVEHQRQSPAPRTTVELEHNSKGYRWCITVAAEDSDTALATVSRLNEVLASQYGSED